jgi:hypothetical protein
MPNKKKTGRSFLPEVEGGRVVLFGRLIRIGNWREG